VPDTPVDVVLTIRAMDGQYHIRSSPGIDNMWPGTTDGLFVGEDNWIAVLCGTQWGPVTISIHGHNAYPTEVDHDWDMAGEWTLYCPTGRLTIQDTYSNDRPTAIDVPTGWVRLRLSVRDRSIAAQAPEPITEPIERHYLQYWPVSDREDPTVVHGPDDYAQGLDSFGHASSSVPEVQPKHRIEQNAVDAIDYLRDAVSHRLSPFTGPVRSVHADTTVDATPSEIFAVLDRMEFWLGMGGVPDFRVGGDFVIYVEPSGQTALWAGGSVRLREPEYRVVFTYAWTSRDLRLNGRAVPADPTIVQVTVRPEGDHSKVSVDHQGVPVELAVHVQAL
jgi:uncharacterized protein YndB with AHSA1/START domain